MSTVLAWTPATAAAPAHSPSTATTIVLVHGAFADSSSWNGVTSRLEKDGYQVIAAANPLRGVRADAGYVASLIASIPGPVVLVGHSYGGEVISAAGNGASNVKALVFVAGLAPDAGESAASLGDRFPSGTLSQALAPPVMLTDGGRDLYIARDRFHAQFAADVTDTLAAQMAVAQRPITQGALMEPAGEPAWKVIPSWFIYGSLDKNIPRDLHAFMARRARARETREVPGASHVVMISHPDLVTRLIEDAASAK